MNQILQVASKSCIFTALLTGEYIEIAPGEDKIPRSAILDKVCKELVFSDLLSKGQFGYITERETKLPRVKYFKQRSLNYKEIFSSAVD